jgi:hypothetical protein
VNRNTYISVKLKVSISPLDGASNSCVTRYAYCKKFAVSNNNISPRCIQVGLRGILQMRNSHVQLYCHHLVNVAKHCIMECGLDYEYLQNMNAGDIHTYQLEVLI